jgi:hypothetical protein
VTSRPTRPLHIDDVPDPLAVSSMVAVSPGAAPVIEHGQGPAAGELRRQRLAAGVRRLRTGAAALRVNERILMLLGGVLAPAGLALVLLGWYGAARTPYVFEQVPYLISGGLLGLGLVFVGAFLYFAHWMTEVVKEQRAQSAAVVEALRRLQDEVRGLDLASASTGGSSGDDGGTLLATRHGSMAHRPDCAVVAGKTGVRAVSPAGGLAPCRLCEPY